MTDETETRPLTHEEIKLQNLENHRAATQFGGERGNTPNMAKGGANIKPHSIRHAIRYLAGQPIDMSDKKALNNLLPSKPTVAQVIAANALAKATKADMRAVEYATEQIDGKLAQANLNADLAALQNMDDEQLYELIREFNAELERQTTSGGCRPDGTAPEGGGETSA